MHYVCWMASIQWTRLASNSTPTTTATKSRFLPFEWRCVGRVYSYTKKMIHKLLWYHHLFLPRLPPPTPLPSSALNSGRWFIIIISMPAFVKPAAANMRYTNGLTTYVTHTPLHLANGKNRHKPTKLSGQAARVSEPRSEWREIQATPMQTGWICTVRDTPRSCAATFLRVNGVLVGFFLLLASLLCGYRLLHCVQPSLAVHCV